MYPLFFIIVLLLPLQVFAEDKAFDTFNCEITPAIQPDHLHLGRFETSNNLRRKEGAGIVANGTYTEIRGMVLDRFCVPVANAVIQLWQADKAGNYREFYITSSPWQVVDENFDENFGYSGTARTNNRGEFTFLTVFPGSAGNHAPLLNMTISHTDFDTLTTQMFFDKHPRNSLDPSLTRLHSQKQQLLLAKGAPLAEDYSEQGRRYEIRITLDGESRYQRF